MHKLDISTFQFTNRRVQQEKDGSQTTVRDQEDYPFIDNLTDIVLRGNRDIKASAWLKAARVIDKLMTAETNEQESVVLEDAEWKELVDGLDGFTELSGYAHYEMVRRVMEAPEANDG